MIERSVQLKIATLFAQWFGVGKIPPSGTIGSLACLPIIWPIHFYSGTLGLGIFLAIVTVIGLWAIHVYQQDHQSHDAQEIVIDEVAGQALCLCFLQADMGAYILGFILFRFFDILKPYPINLIDRYVVSSAGVMLDDMVAGLFSGLLAFVLWPWLIGMIG